MNNYSHISNSAIVGKDTYLGDFVKILGTVKIGNNTYIDDFVVLGYPHSGEINEFMNKYLIEKATNLEEVILKETRVGERSKIMRNSIISAGSVIGNDFFCGPNGFVGADCEIGNRTKINYGAQIYNRVRIGDDCVVGGFLCNDCEIENEVNMMGNAIHKKNHPRTKQENRHAPKIENFANIGFGAILIGNVLIGEGATVGAGAIITKDVEPYDVVAGNPASSIKFRSQYNPARTANRVAQQLITA